MALIGTISGSNGTSTTAISGTLIIADEPTSKFPFLPTGVKLFVSGTKGTDVDSSSSVFGGDVFMSGALGLEEYLQLRVINNRRFPTATTASYIYTSGSTNDLYFTQFSGSLRNDVRLRWLEGTLSTGLLNGGVLSTANGTTTFSATAGSGLIVSQNASITSDPYPTIEYVSWPAFVSSSLVYSGTAQITYVAVDAAGALSQLSTTPTLAQFKDRIILGRILHQTGSVSNGAINSPAMAYAAAANTFDFIRPFGPLKVSGHVLAASGSTMGLTKTAGDSYSEGRNYAFDPSAPNTILAADDPALTESKIYYEYVSGSTTIIDTGIANAGYKFVTASLYNNGGTLAAVGNSEWTNQRVFWFPKSVNRALFVYFGTKKYGTLLESVAGLLTENFVEGDNTKGAAIYVGAVSVKGNELDLSDTTNVTISQGGLFRSAGGGGGGSVGTTPPGGLTTQVQFNDGGAFAGDSGLTYDKLSDSLTVAGNITGSNLLLTSGFVVTGSGIIESNTSTSTLRVTQQGAGNAITVEDAANPDSTPFVVTSTGRVGIGTTTPTSNLFVSGSDSIIPTFVARGHDVAVNTLAVTSSAGANTSIGFVSIDQNNASNKYGLTINNIGVGTAGLKLLANSTGGSFAIDNMNTTPQITMTNKNLWFNSVSTAFDTSQITYKFIENNKAVTYPNQKTFLISGNSNGHKTGSYFEVEKSGSAGSTIKILELQGDTTNNALFVSGSILSSGSIFIAGDLAVSGGNITSTAASLNISAGTSGLAFQQSGTSFATFVSGAIGPLQQATLQAAPDKILVLAGGLGRQVILSGSSVEIRTSASGAPSGISIQADIGGSPQGYLNITSGSYVAGGVTVTNASKIVPGDLPQPHDLLVGASAAKSLYLSGSSIYENAGSGGTFFQRDGSSYGVIQGVSGSSFTIGSAAGVISMNLVSSGNVTVKLDSDNNALGHKFAVQDWRNIDQFSIGENGNAEISGSLYVTGSITTSGTLGSVFSSGDEGGEIFLSKPVTSTTINNGVTIDVWQNRVRIFEQGGTARGGYFDITALDAGASTDLAFTGSSNAYTTTVGSPFTLSIPAGAKIIEIEACGAGGGGGSGRRAALGNNAYGGGGGSGGGRVLYKASATAIKAISSTLTITIGAGGTGGAAQTADDTNGNPGNPGNNTSVSAGATTLITAVGGSNGQGGTGAAGGAGIAPFSQTTGGSGASGQIPPTAAPGGTNSTYTGGGGAGGGRDATNPAAVVQPGGAGGSGGDLFIDNVKRAGTAGTTGGGNGGNASVPANPNPVGGGGGGGGGSANGVAGGAGGNGIQGGGGGAGGAATNGSNSGKGGDGGTGWCVVRFT